MTPSRILLAVVLFSTAALHAPGSEEAILADAPQVANLLLDVSEKMLKATLTQPKDDVSYIEDVILDTHVFATAWTRSCVDLELVPSPSCASIDVVLRGTTWSKSIGYQQPAKIYTTSEMPFVLRKRIGIGGKGVYGDVSCVQVKAATELHRVTNMRDEEFAFADAARRLFYQTREEATYWVELKARQRLITRFETEILPKLKEADKGYQTSLAWVQARLGKSQDKLQFFTTPSTVGVALELQSSPVDKLVPPPPLPGATDLAFRLHESTIREMGQRILAGKTYDLEDLGNLAESLMEALPGKGKTDSKPLPESEPSLDDERLAITFARKGPLVASFSDQGIKIAVQGDNYTMGKDDYQAFRVSASYKLETQAGKFAVARQGRVEVEPIGEPVGNQKKLPKTELAFLRQAFENVFVERLTLPEMTAPAPWDRLGTLSPRSAQVSNGWLLLAWQRRN